MTTENPRACLITRIHPCIPRSVRVCPFPHGTGSALSQEVVRELAPIATIDPPIAGGSCICGTLTYGS